jgi:hypothetical protein
VQNLSVALGEVASFVRENKEGLTGQRHRPRGVHPLPARAAELARGVPDDLGDGADEPAAGLQPQQRHPRHPRQQRPRTARQPAIILCEILIEGRLDPREECEEITEATGLLPPPGVGARVAPARRAPAPAPAARRAGSGRDRAQRDMTLGGILDGGR